MRTMNVPTSAWIPTEIGATEAKAVYSAMSVAFDPHSFE